MPLLAALLLAGGVLATPAAATAAGDGDAPTDPPRTIVLADLGLHVIGLGIQRTVTDRVALQAALDWYVPWAETGASTDIMGGVIRLRPVIHLTDDAPTGLWLSPFVQAGFVRGERDGGGRVGPAGALGASIGWATLIADHLHLSLGLGGQIHGATIPGGAGEPSWYGPFPHVDGTVGWAF